MRRGADWELEALDGVAKVGLKGADDRDGGEASMEVVDKSGSGELLILPTADLRSFNCNCCFETKSISNRCHLYNLLIFSFICERICFIAPASNPSPLLPLPSGLCEREPLRLVPRLFGVDREDGEDTLISLLFEGVEGLVRAVCDAEREWDGGVFVSIVGASRRRFLLLAVSANSRDVDAAGAAFAEESSLASFFSSSNGSFASNVASSFIASFCSFSCSSLFSSFVCLFC